MCVESNPKARFCAQVNKIILDLIIYNHLLSDFHLFFNLGANLHAVISPLLKFATKYIFIGLRLQLSKVHH